jgi:hypothetical protein
VTVRIEAGSKNTNRQWQSPHQTTRFLTYPPLNFSKSSRTQWWGASSKYCTCGLRVRCDPSKVVTGFESRQVQSASSLVIFRALPAPSEQTHFFGSSTSSLRTNKQSFDHLTLTQYSPTRNHLRILSYRPSTKTLLGLEPRIPGSVDRCHIH